MLASGLGFPFPLSIRPLDRRPAYWCLLALLFAVGCCWAEEPPFDPRLDTTLGVEIMLNRDAHAAAIELNRLLVDAPASVTSEQAAQLRHLEARIALEERRAADAVDPARQAHTWWAQHGNARQRSRSAWLQARIQVDLQASERDIDLALSAAEQAAATADDLWVRANVWMLRAYRHSESGAFDKAANDGREALSWARRLGWVPLTALILNNLGNAEKNLGRMGEALALHLEALQLRRQADDGSPRQSGAIVQSLSNIVLVYQRLEDWELAEQYSREAYQRALLLKDRPQRVRIALNHASVRLAHDGAAAATEVLQLLDELGELESLRAQVPHLADVLIRNALSTRASALLLAGKPEQALAPATAAVALARTLASGKELAEAISLELPIIDGSWTAKVRAVGAMEPSEIRAVWSGTLPVQRRFADPEPAPWLPKGIPTAPSALALADS